MNQLALVGGTEWLIIAGVVILIFGGRKLPELARAAGTSITEFKKGLRSGEDELPPAKRRKAADGGEDEDPA